MLGLDNPIHILFVLVIVLLVFGAKRLPEMGKSLGEGLRGFKDSVTGDAPHGHLAHMTADQSPAHTDELTAAAPVATPAPVAAPVPAPEHTDERTVRHTPLTPAA
jgi:sec-independent protein translocase protein TatA